MNFSIIGIDYVEKRCGNVFIPDFSEDQIKESDLMYIKSLVTEFLDGMDQKLDADRLGAWNALVSMIANETGRRDAAKLGEESR